MSSVADVLLDVPAFDLREYTGTVTENHSGSDFLFYEAGITCAHSGWKTGV